MANNPLSGLLTTKVLDIVEPKINKKKKDKKVSLAKKILDGKKIDEEAKEDKYIELLMNYLSDIPTQKMMAASKLAGGKYDKQIKKLAGDVGEILGKVEYDFENKSK